MKCLIKSICLSLARQHTGTQTLTSKPLGGPRPQRIKNPYQTEVILPALVSLQIIFINKDKKNGELHEFWLCCLSWIPPILRSLKPPSQSFLPGLRSYLPIHRTLTVCPILSPWWPWVCSVMWLSISMVTMKESWAWRLQNSTVPSLPCIKCS
jgi:hypothetical protein